jgi:hypothetical protein
VPLPQES